MLRKKSRPESDAIVFKGTKHFRRRKVGAFEAFMKDLEEARVVNQALPTSEVGSHLRFKKIFGYMHFFLAALFSSRILFLNKKYFLF